MLQKMKTQAAAVGANGLIANPVQANKTGVNVLGEAVGAHTCQRKKPAVLPSGCRARVSAHVSPAVRIDRWRMPPPLGEWQALVAEN
jgi:hypothetical protein